MLSRARRRQRHPLEVRLALDLGQPLKRNRRTPGIAVERAPRHFGRIALVCGTHYEGVMSVNCVNEQAYIHPACRVVPVRRSPSQVQVRAVSVHAWCGPPLVTHGTRRGVGSRACCAVARCDVCLMLCYVMCRVVVAYRFWERSLWAGARSAVRVIQAHGVRVRRVEATELDDDRYINRLVSMNHVHEELRVNWVGLRKY